MNDAAPARRQGSARSAVEQRATPQSLEAERAVLGGLLLDSSKMGDVGELLKPDDFFSAAHQRIYGWMSTQAATGSGVFDMLALADHVMGNTPEDFGGLHYATSLPEHVPSSENLQVYAEIVADKAVRRRLLQAALEVADSVYDDRPLVEVLDSAERSVFEVGESKRKGLGWQSVKGLLDQSFQQVVDRSEGDHGDVPGVSTGFVDLDRILTGFQPSDLVILAARPAQGKSSIAVNMAVNAAKNGVGSAINSLEMSGDQLTTRMLAAEAKVDSAKIRTGQLSPDEWLRLEQAHETLHELPIWIDDTAALNIGQIKARARRIKQQQPCLGLLWVDHLSICGGSARSSKQEIVSATSAGLKALAKELSITSIALAQLNRGVEARADKMPMMSDLRDSGAVEQDADVVTAVMRPETYFPDTAELGVANIIVLKNRHGATGMIKLAFQGQYTRFSNMALPAQRGFGGM